MVADAEFVSGWVSIAVIMDTRSDVLLSLTASERKAAIRASFETAVDWWIANYLQLRFTAYARAKLGYELTSSHIKRKKDFGVPEPLVWTGRTRASVLANAKGVVRGSAATLRATVKMGRTWPGIVTEVLERLPQTEANAIEARWLTELDFILSQARSKGGRSKKLTLAGAASPVGRGSGQSDLRRKHEQRVRDAEDFFQDDFIRQEEGREKRANRLERTHARWRRTAGGAAGSPRDGLSQTYKGSARHSAAQRQRRARANRRRRSSF